ncbi:tetratricopeptide repeat protein 27-like isoform X2 [Tigriopus californicus]|uniref:tetratricopeptide repeat protein 27-like isoform X2 n=1 Tax=Tigriopus californicus TaxID=6832 RepID=UPI0027DA8011|nr:tetratricopeptide repeat protein 27-like isoform X2 [Tigriopus californicus]
MYIIQQEFDHHSSVMPRPPSAECRKPESAAPPPLHSQWVRAWRDALGDGQVGGWPPTQGTAESVHPGEAPPATTLSHGSKAGEPSPSPLADWRSGPWAAWIRRYHPWYAPPRLPGWSSLPSAGDVAALTAFIQERVETPSGSTAAPSSWPRESLMALGVAALQVLVGLNFTGAAQSMGKMTEDRSPVGGAGPSEKNPLENPPPGWGGTDGRPPNPFEAWCQASDGEGLIHHVRGAPLLYTADRVFHALADLDEFQQLWSFHWWRLRLIHIRQILHTDDKRPAFHHAYFEILGQLRALPAWTTAPPDLTAWLELEVAAFHALFDELSPIPDILTRVSRATGFHMEETGALGKRTRFQTRDLPQFALTLHTPAQPAGKPTPPAPTAVKDLPPDLKLNDEVRLDKIKFTDPEVEQNSTGLSRLHQAILLAMLFYRRRAKPKDDLIHEELRPYIDTLLDCPTLSWSSKMSVLLVRSQLESENGRTVERSMMQVQALVDHLNEVQPADPQARLDSLYVSRIPPFFVLEQELCTLLQSLGSVKAALDIALRMNFWEDMIHCYHQLQLRHKAAEVIQKQLDIKETPLLYCMLGDATDDLAHYRRALAMTNDRSARAWRSMGIYYYYHKDYPQAVECLSQSIEVSPFQPHILLRLGYAAMEIENWTVAASAYREYCRFEVDNFEAWNNLSNAYIKLGQKSRAWKVLQEAVKADYDNWRIWDNILVVSTDCAAFEEVMRAYHRLLDLREKPVDTDVLAILVQAIRDDVPDNSGEPSGRHLPAALKLFGRLSGQVTNEGRIWELYSDLTFIMAQREEDANPQEQPQPQDQVQKQQSNGFNPASHQERRLKACQYLQKGVACFAQKAGWERDPHKVEEVLQIGWKLAQALDQLAHGHENKAQCIQMISSAKMTLKGIAVKTNQTAVITGDVVEALKPFYEQLLAAIETLEQTLSHLKS